MLLLSVYRVILYEGSQGDRGPLLLFCDADVEVEQTCAVDEDDHLVEHVHIKLSEKEVAPSSFWV